MDDESLERLGLRLESDTRSVAVCVEANGCLAEKPPLPVVSVVWVCRILQAGAAHVYLAPFAMNPDRVDRNGRQMFFEEIDEPDRHQFVVVKAQYPVAQ